MFWSRIAIADLRSNETWQAQTATALLPSVQTVLLTAAESVLSADRCGGNSLSAILCLIRGLKVATMVVQLACINVELQCGGDRLGAIGPQDEAGSGETTIGLGGSSRRGRLLP